MCPRTWKCHESDKSDVIFFDVHTGIALSHKSFDGKMTLMKFLSVYISESAPDAALIRDDLPSLGAASGTISALSSEVASLKKAATMIEALSGDSALLAAMADVCKRRWLMQKGYDDMLTRIFGEFEATRLGQMSSWVPF